MCMFGPFSSSFIQMRSVAGSVCTNPCCSNVSVQLVHVSKWCFQEGEQRAPAAVILTDSWLLSWLGGGRDCCGLASLHTHTLTQGSVISNMLFTSAWEGPIVLIKRPAKDSKWCITGHCRFLNITDYTNNNNGMPPAPIFPRDAYFQADNAKDEASSYWTSGAWLEMPKMLQCGYCRPMWKDVTTQGLDDSSA